MNSLSQTRDAMAADREHAVLHLMEFVDDFRREGGPDAFLSAFAPKDDRLDALAAATAEELCKEKGIEAPSWIEAIGPCHDPWFVSGLENLKAIALVESPLPFRRRKIFVLENFLSRA